MKKTLKIDIDLSVYSSTNILKKFQIIDEISKKINDILENKEQKARTSSVIKASKNAVSLLLSKKKIKDTYIFISLFTDEFY